ncbi:MAG: YeeE/YedE family protein, partial [Candidatus Eremiobacteraeota bacterium]|nr:YeeE/YedE family protein [Candidatus Eremiobacteraeota bacterium]
VEPMRTVLCGLALGFVLSSVGFSDYGEIHQMFLLKDLRLVWVFALTVLLTGVGLQIGKRRLPRHRQPHHPFHPGLIPGGILFGVGWALCGCCPSIAFVQLGEGKLTVLISLAGIALGTVTQVYVNRRFLKWSDHSCGG